MATKYKRELLRVSVAQICSTVGYNSTQNTPLELLQDVLNKFLIEFSRDLRRHVENYNRLEANLNDTLLSLNNLNINLFELMDYITNVEPVPFGFDVPKYPKKKNSNLNFLKPGSKEVVSRPVHVFEYLPPTLPSEAFFYNNATDSGKKNVSAIDDKETPNDLNRSKFFAKEIKNQTAVLATNLTSENNTTIEKYTTLQNTFFDEGHHPTREISSVVMTSGGFISPAMEGKVPDSIVPDLIEKFQGLDVPITESKTNDITIKKMEPNIIEIETSNNGNANLESKINKTHSDAYILSPRISNANPKMKMQQNLFENEVNELSEKAKRKKLKLLQKTKKNKNGDEKKKVLKKIAKLKSAVEYKLKKNVSNATNPETVEDIQMENRSLPQNVCNVEHGNSVLNNDAENMNRPIIKNTHISTLNSMQTPQNQFPDTDAASSSLPDKPKPDFTNFNDNVGNTFPDSMKFKNRPEELHFTSEKKAGIKLAVIPDRSKLDIFKKITKPKTLKECGLQTNQFVKPTNDSFMPVQRTLINLPSGTTITPAPSLEFPTDFSNNHDAKFSNNYPDPNTSSSVLISETIKAQSALLNPSNTETNQPTNQPKKRGRKPGSKNQPKVLKQVTPTKPTFITKDNQPIFKNPNSTTNLAFTETNLFNTNTMEFRKSLLNKKENTKKQKELTSKEKKQKKKNKIRGLENLSNDSVNLTGREDNFTEDIANMSKNDDQNNLSVGLSVKPINDLQVSNDHSMISLTKKKIGKSPNNVVGRPKTLDGTSVPSSISSFSPNSNMFPMHPLAFAFPTRPGLIPSTNIFQTNAMTLSNHGHSVETTNMLLNSLLPFGNLKGTHPTSDIFSQEKGRVDSKSSSTFPDHNFCNVPPLIPEFMSLNANPGFLDANGSSNNMRTIPSPKLKVAKKNLYSQQNRFEELKIDREGSLAELSSFGADTVGHIGNFLNDPLKKSTFQNLPLNMSNENQYFNFPNTSTTVTAQTSIIQQQGYKETPKITANELIELSDDSNEAPDVTTKKKIKSFKSIKGMAKTIKKQKITKKTKKNILTSSSLDLLSPNDKIPENIQSNCYGKLAGGAELIPLMGIGTGLAYSSKTIPTTSLTGNTLINKEISQVDNKYTSTCLDQMAILPNSSEHSTLKKKKENRKLKKIKEGKIKKKKDKKEKFKNRDRMEKTSSSCFNNDIKKVKKNKKKEKQVEVYPTANFSSVKNVSGSDVQYNMQLENTKNIFDGVPSVNQTLHLPLLQQIPKLTLKFSENTTSREEFLEPESSPPKPIGEREPSPELARISPLVTGPPKQKFVLDDSSRTPFTNDPLEKQVTDSNKLPVTTTKVPDSIQAEIAPPNPWLSGGTLTASSVLLPQQLSLKTESKKAADSIENVPVETRPSSYVDAEGNIVWICPACGKVDDGSAMIGCDGCDAWYHWVCVGIFVAPKDNEDWYCRQCVYRKKGAASTDKKRKRSKKK